jgi:hypothetical protein
VPAHFVIGPINVSAVANHACGIDDRLSAHRSTTDAVDLSFLLQEAIEADPSVRLRALDCAAEIQSMLIVSGAGKQLV